MQRLLIPIKTEDQKQKCIQIKTKITMFKKRFVKTWTLQQDQKLIALHAKYPRKWNIISEQMKNRNQNQCLHRYRRICQMGQNKKIWSQKQDQIVLKMINKVGHNWKAIAAQLGTKSGKQIRQRFINKLDPKIKRQQWTEQQDLKIIQLFTKWGSKWCDISKCLPGRPQNKIKNRFYSYIQKNYEFQVKDKLSDNEQKLMIPQIQNKQNSPAVASYRTIQKKESQSLSLSKKSSSNNSKMRILEQKKNSNNLSLMTQQNMTLSPVSKQKANLEVATKHTSNQVFHQFSSYQKQKGRFSSEYNYFEQQQNFEQMVLEQQFSENKENGQGSMKQINEDQCYYKYNFNSANQHQNNDLLYFEDNE